MYTCSINVQKCNTGLFGLCNLIYTGTLHSNHKVMTFILELAVHDVLLYLYKFDILSPLN